MAETKRQITYIISAENRTKHAFQEANSDLQAHLRQAQETGRQLSGFGQIQANIARQQATATAARAQRIAATTTYNPLGAGASRNDMAALMYGVGEGGGIPVKPAENPVETMRRLGQEEEKSSLVAYRRVFATMFKVGAFIKTAEMGFNVIAAISNGIRGNWQAVEKAVEKIPFARALANTGIGAIEGIFGFEGRQTHQARMGQMQGFFDRQQKGWAAGSIFRESASEIRQKAYEASLGDDEAQVERRFQAGEQAIRELKAKARASGDLYQQNGVEVGTPAFLAAQAAIDKLTAKDIKSLRAESAEQYRKSVKEAAEAGARDAGQWRAHFTARDYAKSLAAFGGEGPESSLTTKDAMDLVRDAFGGPRPLPGIVERGFLSSAPGFGDPMAGLLAETTKQSKQLDEAVKLLGGLQSAIEKMNQTAPNVVTF